MGGLSAVYLAVAGALAFAAASFAVPGSRRRGAERLLPGALAAASAAAAVGLWGRLDSSRDATPGQGMVERVGLFLAFALVWVLGPRLAPSPRTTTGAALLGPLLLTSDLVLGALGFLDARVVDGIGFGLGAAAAALLLAASARAYLAGRRELGGVICGAGVLLLTAAYDAARGVDGWLSPLGLLGVVAGLTAQRITEQDGIARRFDAQARELRDRSRELHESHDALEVVRGELSTKGHFAAIGELAAVVAHEIRNPLAILANAVASLRKPALAADDRATLLEIIDSEAGRLNRIVTDLLSFSRPITVQRGPVDLRELVERALRLSADRPDVEVELDADGADARVSADGNLLRQVFDNLIDNALQAMEKGGRLLVRVHGDPSAGDGRAVAVDVVDTGEGMNTDVRRRAKDPFFTTRPSGTGLGLAIVDRIVEAHGGRLEIDSRTGLGTRVTVVLPQTVSSEPPPRRAPGDPAGVDAKAGRDA